MTDEEFDKYLNGRYAQAVSWYDKRATTNKRLFYGLSCYLFFASAFLTGVSGLADWKVWSVIAAGGSSVAAAVLGLSKCHETWLGYRATWDALQSEPHFRNAGLGDYSKAVDRNALFVERVEKLIATEGAEWLARNSEKRKSVGAGH